DAADGATEYKIQYRPVGAISWETKTASAPKTARIIKGLDCNTTYEYQIAGICDGIVSAFTSIQTITTLDCKIGDMPLTETLLIFPNPATDVITINIDEEIVADNISVTDLQGNIVLQRNLPANSMVIDISGLANGTYIIIAQTPEGMQHAYFVKQ
ncbi:MAG TPA: T9SS type A sorting domain-containing protein, partial [Chitinophagales bacterium]|nr:T9SS type A sorting domain-containing protein [Chitinophagales bacterium]